MKTTKIEWTDRTWNPITGCSRKSTGCLHCYAEVMTRRLKAMRLDKYANGFEVTLRGSTKLPWKSSGGIMTTVPWNHSLDA